MMDSDILTEFLAVVELAIDGLSKCLCTLGQGMGVIVHLKLVRT